MERTDDTASFGVSIPLLGENQYGHEETSAGAGRRPFEARRKRPRLPLARRRRPDRPTARRFGGRGAGEGRRGRGGVSRLARGAGTAPRRARAALRRGT